MRADSSRGTAVPSSRSTFSSRSRIVCGAGPFAADVDRALHQPRARQLEHQLGGDDLAVHRLLGREALLEAPGGLRAQGELGRGALEARAVPVGGLHQHARGGPADLGALAAHQAGDRRRAVLVGDQQDAGVERALDVVERRHLLALAGAPHGELSAGDEVEVEGVQRLPGEQHREVGDVDDVVDRALAGGGQARLQPRRRRADRDVLEQPRGEARAEVGVLDDDLGARDVAGGARVVGPRRRRERRARDRVHLAGDAVDAQAVGPVGRDLELEHVGGDRQRVGQRSARLEVLRQHHDPVVLAADRDLVLGEDHPARFLAAQLGLLELGAVGHDRARRGDRDGLARRDVRRAADDLVRLALADVDRADRQAVRVGMALGRQDLADPEVLERGDAVAVHAVDLRAGHGEPGRQLVRRQAGVHVVVQPEQRQPHPNCSRKRRSFS